MPTVKEIKEELKAKGIKGITGKNKTELLAMLSGETVSSVTSKTIKELKADLKAMGVKGITGKTKKELIAMIVKHTGNKGNKDKENDDFFADAYKQLGKTPKPRKKTTNMDDFLAKAQKKLEKPTLTKQNDVTKKMSGSLQEKLAKQGLRGGLKKKYKI
jgi:hypothetical protein